MYAHVDSLTSWDILISIHRCLATTAPCLTYCALEETRPPRFFLSGERKSKERENVLTKLLYSMYYHFSIILIFYPLINLRFLDSNVSALDVYIDGTNTIISLVQSSKSLYRLRQAPCFLPCIILASSITHLGTTDLRINPINILT
jgi:hypothetical protein